MIGQGMSGGVVICQYMSAEVMICQGMSVMSGDDKIFPDVWIYSLRFGKNAFLEKNTSL